MSEIDPSKLKVTELREELKSRGLDTKGTKPVLVKRLKKALNEEKGGPAADESVEDSAADESHDTSMLDDSSTQETQESPPKSVPQSEQVNVEASPEKTKSPVKEEPVTKKETPVKSEPVSEKNEKIGNTEPELTKEESASEPMKTEDTAAVENGDEKPSNDRAQDEEMTTVDEVTDDGDERRHRRKRSRSPRSRSRSRSRSHERHHRDDRRRSRSRERRRSYSPKKVEMEDETWETSTDVVLDRFNSDLSLQIDVANFYAAPMTEGGFAMMWAGVRATYGVSKGKVAFEVRLTENCDVSHLPADEIHQNVARVGWSANSTSMQLGEEAKSFGYGGTGKAATECKFEDYGQQFTAGDVITAYVDYEMDPNEVYISFAKNGDDLGICFPVEKSKLDDEALFPHILVKNTAFECNFGAMEEPWFPLKEEFIFIDKVPVEERTRGTSPPAKKEECEMIMMVGLPASGKTTWAEKFQSSNPEKLYNILGTNLIIDKMRVMGLPRKKNYAGRWDVLIDKSTKCLNKLLEVAATKKRNYILDQTNVYASARRRKMQPFEGFQRKAIVIVPTEEDFKTRLELQGKVEGKDVPEHAVLEMKANFSLPEEGVLFDSVEYPEQDLEAIKELVEKYNKEGKDNLPPPHKRSRFSRDDRDRRDNRSRHDRYGSSGGGGRNGGWRDNRYGSGHGGGGGWGGDRRSGGWSNNRQGGGGGRDRNDRRFSGGGDRRDRDRYQGGGRSWGSGGGGSKWSNQGSRSSGWSGGSSGSQGSWGGSGSQGSYGGNWNQSSWGNQQQWGNQGYGQWNYAQGGSGQQNWGGQGYWQQQQYPNQQYQQWYGQQSGHYQSK